MALGNSNSAIYLSVSDGKIVRRFKEPTAQSKARTNKMGNTVHEESYDYVEGMITGITAALGARSTRVARRIIRMPSGIMMMLARMKIR